MGDREKLRIALSGIPGLQYSMAPDNSENCILQSRDMHHRVGSGRFLVGADRLGNYTFALPAVCILPPINRNETVSQRKGKEAIP